MSTDQRVSRRTREAFVLLGVALATAVAYRVLAVSLPERLDAAAAAGLTILLLAALAASGGGRFPPRVWQLALPAVLFTAAMLWRDSPVLFLLDVGGFASVLMLLLPQARAPRTARAGVTDYIRAGASWGAATVLGPLPLAAREIRWSELSPQGLGGRVRRVGLGLAASIPCLLMFGSLFRSADAGFDRAVGRLTSFDPGPLGEHGPVVLVWAWCAAGYLWLVFRGSPSRRLIPRHGRVGEVELVTALGIVLALFVTFMAFQVNYLFGGAAATEAMGMTYSEYARRGFFELVAVAVLTLPLLLAADWAIDPSDRAARRRVRWLQGAFVGVLFVLLASALDRMRLYTAEYGLTELRLYTSAFMAWLAIVLGWFVGTVLQDRRTRFAWGAAVAGWLIVGALHLINPDALIVEVNGARDRRFDAAYAAGLSADAIPALLDVLRQEPAATRCGLADAVEPLAKAARYDDRWTIGRMAARRALAGDAVLAACGRSPT